MDKLFNAYPRWEKPSNYRAKSWTSTIQGYLNEAGDLARCILTNCKLMGHPYAWFVSVNIEVELEPWQHRVLWKKVCYALRRAGVIALWVREPSRANHVNYHLLVSNPVPEGDLRQLFKGAIVHPNHVHVRSLDTPQHYAFYIVKAKKGGYREVRSKVTGRTERVWYADKYGHKRLLFKPNTKLKKYGTIGKFWLKPKATILNDIIESNVRIAAGLRLDGVRDLVDYVIEHLGVKPTDARREIGYYAAAPGIRRWIDQLRIEGELPPSASVPCTDSTLNTTSIKEQHEAIREF